MKSKSIEQPFEHGKLSRLQPAIGIWIPTLIDNIVPITYCFVYLKLQWENQVDKLENSSCFVIIYMKWLYLPFYNKCALVKALLFIIYLFAVCDKMLQNKKTPQKNFLLFKSVFSSLCAKVPPGSLLAKLIPSNASLRCNTKKGAL